MKCVNVFLDVDMRSGHQGLTIYAKKKGVDLRAMNNGHAVVFINRARNKMKCYSYNGVLSYYRSDDVKRPIDLTTIEMFPRAFSPDGSMDYNKALKASLEKQLTGRALPEKLL